MNIMQIKNMNIHKIGMRNVRKSQWRSGDGRNLLYAHPTCCGSTVNCADVITDIWTTVFILLKLHVLGLDIRTAYSTVTLQWI